MGRLRSTLLNSLSISAGSKLLVRKSADDSRHCKSHLFGMTADFPRMMAPAAFSLILSSSQYVHQLTDVFQFF
jgi:hypothetical protein